jgi:hypothetical protein
MRVGKTLQSTPSDKPFAGGYLFKPSAVKQIRRAKYQERHEGALEPAPPIGIFRQCGNVSARVRLSEGLKLKLET